MVFPHSETQLQEILGEDYLFFPEADPDKKEKRNDGKFEYADKSIDEQLLLLCMTEDRIEWLFDMKKDLGLSDFDVIAACFGLKAIPGLPRSREMCRVAAVQLLCTAYPKRKATILRYASGVLLSGHFDALEAEGSEVLITELFEAVNKPLAALVAMMPEVKNHEQHDEEIRMARLRGVKEDFEQIAKQYHEALTRDHGVVLTGVSYIENEDGEIEGYMEEDMALELVDIGASGDDKIYVDLKDENGTEKSLEDLVCEDCGENVVLKEDHEAYCPVCERIFLSKRGVSDLKCEDCGRDLLYIGTNESYCPHCDKIFSKITSISGIQDVVKTIERS